MRPPQHHETPVLRTALFALIGFSLTALAGSCGSGGGGGGSPAVDDPVITRIEITPGSVTLGALDESYSLTAQAYNAAGLAVDAEFAWTSSDPDNVSVDTEGLLTAMGVVGSAIITAEADGIESGPATVLVVVPAPNSQFVDDSQVVGDFTLVDPEAAFVPGVLYEVTLTGIDPPAIGTILLGREEAPVGGEVVDVRAANGDVVVTLKLLPLDELFAELKIDQTFDLSNVEAQISETAADFYAMERQPDGSYLFTSLPNIPVEEKGKFPLGPFTCETTLPTIPVTLDVFPTTYNLTTDIDFILSYDSANGGLQKLSLKGELKAEFKVNPTLTVAFEGKVECQIELMTLTVPLGGPFALFFGGQIPIGAGFEVGGKITVAQLGAEMSSEATVTGEIGLACPNGTDCETISTLSSESKAGYKWVLPDAANLDSQLRIEPSLNAHIFYKLAVGSSFFRRLRLDALVIKAGLTQAANLSTVSAQVGDSDYKSEYKLTLDLVAGLARDAVEVFELLSVNVPRLEVKLSLILYESPKAEAAKADVSSFEIGDTVTFTVTLDRNTLDYVVLLSPTPYNIDDIIIYRKIDMGGGTIDVEEVARVAAAPVESEFTLTWTATEAGDVEDNFFAFVDTKALSIPLSNGLLGVPFIDELEIAKVEPGAGGPFATVTSRTAYAEAGADWSHQERSDPSVPPRDAELTTGDDSDAYRPPRCDEPGEAGCPSVNGTATASASGPAEHGSGTANVSCSMMRDAGGNFLSARIQGHASASASGGKSFDPESQTQLQWGNGHGDAAAECRFYFTVLRPVEYIMTETVNFTGVQAGASGGLFGDNCPSGDSSDVCFYRSVAGNADPPLLGSLTGVLQPGEYQFNASAGGRGSSPSGETSSSQGSGDATVTLELEPIP
ncbi:MAG: hypothetical protein JRD94_07355 [Deltaproteobacteria bacterium]|nr:hypothetical protein [Deltaproteobacteria bacterium]